MVQADIAQLTGECGTWRETLRLYRDELTQHKTRLQQAAGQPLSKAQLQEVEHLHNQFHIQLINIHDLKHAIKVHDRKMGFDVSANNGQFNEETFSEHENLFDQYQTLDHTLQDLRDEFKHFLSRT